MTQSIDLTGSLSYIQQPNFLVINSPNSEKLLEITNDGDVFFRLNEEWKKLNVRMIYHLCLSRLYLD